MKTSCSGFLIDQKIQVLCIIYRFDAPFKVDLEKKVRGCLIGKTACNKLSGKMIEPFLFYTKQFKTKKLRHTVENDVHPSNPFKIILLYIQVKAERRPPVGAARKTREKIMVSRPATDEMTWKFWTEGIKMVL